LPTLDFGLRVDPFENPDWREMASANVKDFAGFGFGKVWNPLLD